MHMPVLKSDQSHFVHKHPPQSFHNTQTQKKKTKCKITHPSLLDWLSMFVSWFAFLSFSYGLASPALSVSDLFSFYISIYTYNTYLHLLLSISPNQCSNTCQHEYSRAPPKRGNEEVFHRHGRRLHFCHHLPLPITHFLDGAGVEFDGIGSNQTRGGMTQGWIDQTRTHIQGQKHSLRTKQEEACQDGGLQCLGKDKVMDTVALKFPHHGLHYLKLVCVCQNPTKVMKNHYCEPMAPGKPFQKQGTTEENDSKKRLKLSFAESATTRPTDLAQPTSN